MALDSLWSALKDYPSIYRDSDREIYSIFYANVSNQFSITSDFSTLLGLDECLEWVDSTRLAEITATYPGNSRLWLNSGLHHKQKWRPKSSSLLILLTIIKNFPCVLRCRLAPAVLSQTTRKRPEQELPSPARVTSEKASHYPGWLTNSLKLHPH